MHEDISRSRELKEIEAESVAYVVSNWLGLDSSEYSFGYVLEWGESLKQEEIKVALVRISECSKLIIRSLESNY